MKFFPFQASSQNSLSCPLEYRFMFRKRRASSSATNAIPCGHASNRTAIRSIVLSDTHSRGATKGPGSVALGGLGGAGRLFWTASATACSHFFLSALAFCARVSCSLCSSAIFCLRPRSISDRARLVTSMLGVLPVRRSRPELPTWSSARTRSGMRERDALCQ